MEHRTSYRTRNVLFSFCLGFALGNLFDGVRQIIRMMMAICIEQDLERHSQIACRLPRIRPPLHQPGRRGMSQRVRREPVLKLGEPHRAFERRLHGCHRLAIELDEVFRFRCNPMPASKMSEQTRRNRYRRLPLVGPRAPLLAAVVMLRSKSTKARPIAGIGEAAAMAPARDPL